MGNTMIGAMRITMGKKGCDGVWVPTGETVNMGNKVSNHKPSLAPNDSPSHISKTAPHVLAGR